MNNHNAPNTRDAGYLSYSIICFCRVGSVPHHFLEGWPWPSQGKVGTSIGTNDINIVQKERTVLWLWVVVSELFHSHSCGGLTNK